MTKIVDFDLIGRLKEREESEKPYHRFSLSRNPFPKSAIADRHSIPFFSRSRIEALERIREFVLYTYRSTRWSGLTLLGEYGSGKSHALFYVCDEINRQLGSLDNNIAIAIYIEHPKDTINDLYGEMIEKIDRERFELFVARTLEESAYDLLKPFIYKMSEIPNEQAENPLKKLRLLGKRIVQSKKEECWNKLSKYWSSQNIVVHHDIAQCLAIMMTENDPTIANSAWNFLTGKRLTRNESQRLKLLSEQLSEDEIIKYAFPSMVNILNKNGISMVFLLLDELEKIVPKPRQKAFEFLENMRSLIDNNLNNFSIILSCVDEAWGTITQLSPGLADRIGEVVKLGELTDLEMKLLVEDYLKLTRYKDFRGESYAPFTTDCLREINRYSKGIIRSILENCFMILEKSSMDPRIDTVIDRDCVLSMLRR